MTVPNIKREQNTEMCRSFVRWVQESTADQIGTYAVFEYDGWLVVATWDGSDFNDRLRDFIAAEGGKPQTIAERK